MLVSGIQCNASTILHIFQCSSSVLLIPFIFSPIPPPTSIFKSYCHVSGKRVHWYMPMDTWNEHAYIFYQWISWIRLSSTTGNSLFLFVPLRQQRPDPSGKPARTMRDLFCLNTGTQCIQMNITSWGRTRTQDNDQGNWYLGRMNTNMPRRSEDCASF